MVHESRRVPMRILVTGGAGFIGSHLVRRLIQRGSELVVNLDALRYSGNLDNLVEVEGHPNYRFVHGDICDHSLVERVFREYAVEAVINCAAETHVDRSILDPLSFAKTDVVGTGVLLEAAKQAGVERYVQVSTDEVYGSVEEGHSREDDRVAPRNPYSASKAAGDLLALSYWTTYGFPVMVTRGSNTYGPNQYPEKLIPLFVTNAIDEQLLPLYGDGRHRRDWLHVEDHCAGIELVLRKGEPGLVYNIGGGNERENLAVVEEILELLDKSKSLIRFVEDRSGHDRRYAVDSGRLKALGWAPGIPWDIGLKSTVEWYRSHERWWRKMKNGPFRQYYQRVYSQRLSGA